MAESHSHQLRGTDLARISYRPRTRRSFPFIVFEDEYEDDDEDDCSIFDFAT